MQVNTKERLVNQLRSIITYEFLKEYNMFEKSIRDNFEQSLEDIEQEHWRELYFMYGGRIHPYYEYNTPSIKLNDLKYKSNEKFPELTINQIIKFDRSKNIVRGFDFEIQSIQVKKNFFEFRDCALKLISMRNKLSHELDNCTFKECDMIELLSYDNISENYFDEVVTYDLSIMDDNSKCIFSNIIYMKIILKKMINT